MAVTASQAQASLYLDTRREKKDGTFRLRSMSGMLIGIRVSTLSDAMKTNVIDMEMTIRLGYTILH